MKLAHPVPQVCQKYDPIKECRTPLTKEILQRIGNVLGRLRQAVSLMAEAASFAASLG